jgi:hypothetical protein
MFVNPLQVDPSLTILISTNNILTYKEKVLMHAKNIEKQCITCHNACFANIDNFLVKFIILQCELLLNMSLMRYNKISNKKYFS